MPPYTPPVDRLLTLGRPEVTDDWDDYSLLGITSDHVPELIRLMGDTQLFLAEPESDATWGLVHAWRALGELRPTEAVAPYLELMTVLGEKEADEWVREEAPEFFARIGPAVLPVLAAFLADQTHGLYPRWGIAEAMSRMAERHPECRPEVLAILTRQLEHAAENEPELNGGLIAELLDLKAVETAPVIERAFATDQVDEWTVGSWEEVQYELGLRAEPPPPRRNPFLSPAVGGPSLPPAGGRTPATRAKERAKAKKKETKKARKKNRKKKR